MRRAWDADNTSRFRHMGLILLGLIFCVVAHHWLGTIRYLCSAVGSQDTRTPQGTCQVQQGGRSGPKVMMKSFAVRLLIWVDGLFHRGRRLDSFSGTPPLILDEAWKLQLHLSKDAREWERRVRLLQRANKYPLRTAETPPPAAGPPGQGE